MIVAAKAYQPIKAGCLTTVVNARCRVNYINNVFCNACNQVVFYNSSAVRIVQLFAIGISFACGS